jgi:c-di-GMP-binding flagellar brake protein YcgR
MAIQFGNHKKIETTRPLPPLVFEPINSEGKSYQALQNPASILRKLQELQRKRFSIKISLYEDDTVVDSYRSSVQRIEPNSRSIILHQLIPNTWREHILARHPVAVSCRMPSGHLVFDSHMAPLERSVNNLFCQLDFPTVLHLQQLRAAFRVPLLPNTSRVQLRLAGHLFNGKCVDLSLTGCCAQFPGELNELLAEKSATTDNLPLCFEYKGEEVFHTTSKICRQKQEAFGALTVGLSFAKADPLLNRRLQPLLLNLQRENIRHLPVVA